MKSLTIICIIFSNYRHYSERSLTTLNKICIEIVRYSRKLEPVKGVPQVSSERICHIEEGPQGLLNLDCSEKCIC